MTRPYLPQVTLVAATSIAFDQTVTALRSSMEQVRFGKCLLLSDQQPRQATPGIEWRPISRLRSRSDYSHFMLRQLVEHVETSHALCIQWDGYVLDGSRWKSQFLDYDYIGAPWPHFRDRYNVGNGGFSLRSLRLLELCKSLPVDEHRAEDLVIGRDLRPVLEQQGVRFASEEVARQFAYERLPPRGDEFGFHGAFNLVRLLAPEDALKLFSGLEPTVLARSEHWELLRFALAHGRLNLAGRLFQRLL